MTRDFARTQFLWLEQVKLDRELTPTAVLTALALLKFFNHKSGEAWPSNATLAVELGVDRRTIQRALALLVERRHLTVIGSRRGGRRHSNHYQLRLDNKQAETLNDNQKGPKGRHGRHPLEKGRQMKTERAANEDQKGRHDCRPNLLNEPNIEPSAAALASAPLAGALAQPPRARPATGDGPQGVSQATALAEAEDYLNWCEILATSRYGEVQAKLKSEISKLNAIVDDPCLPERLRGRASRLLNG